MPVAKTKKETTKKTSNKISLPTLPVRNASLLPGVTMPLMVGRRKSLLMVEDLLAIRGASKGAAPSLIYVAAQKDAAVEDPLPSELYSYGCVAEVLDVDKVDDNAYSLLVKGIGMARPLSLRENGYMFAEIEKNAVDVSRGYRTEEENAKLEVFQEHLGRVVSDLLSKAGPMQEELRRDFEEYEKSKGSNTFLMADIVVGHMHAPFEKKQEYMAMTDPLERCKTALDMVVYELELLKVAQQINREVKMRIDGHQREYFLREQMKAIQKELGEGEMDELDDLRKKIEKAQMPPEVRAAADKELSRLARIPSTSPEHNVSRTYLDWLIDLPWGRATEDNLDIGQAAKILDEDHWGLDKVKKRILEFLAVRKLKPDVKGPILALIGPPGVGKTSLGRSIARALGRKFVRVSLGGIRDEAEIRGHRRTYIGALPGRIIQGVKRAGYNNPVFMLDEIDKLASDYRGDPSSALLEALDPEQNGQFSDHYIEAPVDLSNVMFICTANVADTIPPALKDRLEIIELPGYTSNEKYHIAEKFLIPEQIFENGLKAENVEFTPEAVDYAIDRYTREAGVRNLKREIGGVCRAVACEVASNKLEGRAVITPQLIEKYLGPEKFERDAAEKTDRVGVATGLAWTPHGGDIIFVEAAGFDAGRGELKLTGHLGEVMKESASAALSYIRANAAALGAKTEDISGKDYHIHVPAGAIPKDGPSAGVTMFAALASVILKKAVRGDVAMTGEITLRGKVLPVGGIKEKMLAAHRAGLRTALLPGQNEKDLIDVPPEIKNEMKFVFVRDMAEVLSAVLA